MESKRLKNIRGLTDRRIDALLTLLSENSTIVISGAKIAKEIGMSRGTVWRWVQKLRALGVRVKGHPRKGYHIDRIPDILAPKLSAAACSILRSGSASTISSKSNPRTTSPCNSAKKANPTARSSSPKSKRGARPRRARLDTPKNPAASTAPFCCARRFRPRKPRCSRSSPASPRATPSPKNWTPRRTFAGPTICSSDGKKFCGILTEMHAEPDRMHYAVVGIGINVNQARLPAEIAGIATSLRIESGRIHSRLEILIRLLRHLDRYYNRFVTEGPQPIVRRFAEVSSLFSGQARAHHDRHRNLSSAPPQASNPAASCACARDDGRVDPVISGDVVEA